MKIKKEDREKLEFELSKIDYKVLPFSGWSYDKNGNIILDFGKNINKDDTMILNEICKDLSSLIYDLGYFFLRKNRIVFYPYYLD